MKIKKIIPVLLIICGIIVFQSCDKIEAPYTEGIVTPPPPTGNSSDVINIGTIKGSASDFKVSDNWISDSTALNATWTITPTGSGADGAVTFTWHGTSATLNVSSASGIITISSPVSIIAGGLYGTLSFKYSATFTSDGAGEGYVAAYVLNEQNVLIEDYTGHTCGNCPKAAIELTSIKEDYSRVLSMAVHAGGYADTANPSNPDGSYSYDFKTPAGTELDAFFGISSVGNPNGLVNRNKYNGSYIASYGSWRGHANDIIVQNNFPDAGIKIENSYNSSDNTLNIKVKTCFFNDLVGTYKVCVFLLEDSIQKWQKKYPPLTPLHDPDYWHHDVLRGSANGTWGDILSPSTKGTLSEKNYTMTLKSDYRPAYCKVLVFIHDDISKQIIQVQEAPIIQ